MYKIGNFLKSKGYEISDTELIKPYIKTWKSWYVNNVPSFQNYYVFNGDNKVRKKRFTLGMAKKICEDYANLLLNEKVKFNIGSQIEESETNSMQDAFNDILDKNDFYVLANAGIEKTFAYGTGAFVLSLRDINYNEDNDTYSFDDSSLNIEFVTADKIIPLTYNKQKIIECAFASEKVVDNKRLLYLTLHRISDENKNYIIENYLFEISKGGNLTDISDKIEDAFKIFDTLSDIPWFSILRPGTENCISDESPFGMSIYANAIDIIKGIDIAYDSFVNEFVLGKKRIFVSAEMLRADVINGELKYSFDPNDCVLHQLPFNSEDKTLIKEIDMNLRVNEHEQGIQLGLNLLSGNVNLGTEFYKFTKSKVSTATEIISENSDLFRAIHKHEIRIENCLYDLFRTICYIGRTFLSLPLNENEDISIDFDDSIFEDKKEIKQTAILELNNRLIGPVQYYMKVYNMTKKQAEDYYKEVQESIPKVDGEEPIEE